MSRAQGKERLVRYSLLQEIDQGQTLPEGGQDWSLRLCQRSDEGSRKGRFEVYRHREGLSRRCGCSRKRRGGRRRPFRRIRIGSVEATPSSGLAKPTRKRPSWPHSTGTASRRSATAGSWTGPQLDARVARPSLRSKAAKP